MIGFCTEKGFGNNCNFYHAESAYYHCSGNGCLYEGGSGKELISSGSANGEVVECIADLVEWKISWRKAGKLLGEATVPVGIRGKKLYFSLMLLYAGDEVEVSAI